MRNRFQAAATALLLILAATTHAQNLTIEADYALPAATGSAWDIRWIGDASVFVALTEGVSEVSLLEGRVTVKPVTRRGTFVRLGTSNEYLAGGAPFGPFGWMRRSAPEKTAGSSRLATLVDLDVWRDRVLLLGAARDALGQWSPDGAIAFAGSLSTAAALRPVHFARSKNAMTMANCEFLELGAVRFLSDGRFVIVPGVEPGVFLYSAEGRLLRTWDTEDLGFVDRCTLDAAQRRELGGNPLPRFAWLNARAVLDDLIVIGDSPALIIRSVRGGMARWELVTLGAGTPVRTALPLTGRGPDTHLRADVRGDRIALLLFDYTAPPAKPRPSRIVILRSSRK